MTIATCIPDCRASSSCLLGLCVDSSASPPPSSAVLTPIGKIDRGKPGIAVGSRQFGRSTVGRRRPRRSHPQQEHHRRQVARFHLDPRPAQRVRMKRISFERLPAEFVCAVVTRRVGTRARPPRSPRGDSRLLRRLLAIRVHAKPALRSRTPRPSHRSPGGWGDSPQAVRPARHSPASIAVGQRRHGCCPARG